MDDIDRGATFVPMKNPDTGGTAMTTIAAFDEMWGPIGWVRVTPESVSEDELRKVARDQGVVVPVTGDIAEVHAILNPDLVEAAPVAPSAPPAEQLTPTQRAKAEAEAAAAAKKEG